MLPLGMVAPLGPVGVVPSDTDMALMGVAPAATFTWNDSYSFLAAVSLMLAAPRAVEVGRMSAIESKASMWAPEAVSYPAAWAVPANDRPRPDSVTPSASTAPARRRARAGRLLVAVEWMVVVGFMRFSWCEVMVPVSVSRAFGSVGGPTLAVCAS